MEADYILFVVHPSNDNWAINGTKLSNNTFDQRAALPAVWAGLTDAVLEEVSGVNGVKFFHNERSIAVASSREAILKMAGIAVQEVQ